MKGLNILWNLSLSTDTACGSYIKDKKGVLASGLLVTMCQAKMCGYHNTDRLLQEQNEKLGNFKFIQIVRCAKSSPSHFLRPSICSGFLGSSITNSATKLNRVGLYLFL